MIRDQLQARSGPPGGVLQRLNKIVRKARNLHLSANSASFIHDANGRLFHGDVQAGIMLHAALPFLMLVAVHADHVLSSARSAAPQTPVQDVGQSRIHGVIAVASFPSLSYGSGWLFPDRMEYGLTIRTGPRHLRENSHGRLYWPRCFDERDSGFHST